MTDSSLRRLDRKLIVQIACILLALPILYVASSGPVLSFAAHRDDDALIRWQGVQGFYRPLLDLVKATALEQPLTAYLKVWGLRPFRIRTGHEGPVVFIALSRPGVHHRIYHGSQTYPDDVLKPGR